MKKVLSESHAEVIVRMFPTDANPAGNVFGGEILKHIDMVAGIVAQRHSQSNAVTVSMDSVNFLKPHFCRECSQTECQNKLCTQLVNGD